jgi:hypothetical protein
MKYAISFLVFASILTACNSGNSNKQSNENNDNAEQQTAPDTVAIREGQAVFFENLSDGQSISLPFVVMFGVKGMEVVPAEGAAADQGHHHLIVDQTYVPANTMVPMSREDRGYFHFGKGQTGDTLNINKYPMLTPGKHTLTLQFANGLHMSYGPAMSKTIKVEVKP